MLHLSQSPTDPDFVQNPYPFYARARAQGDMFHWDEYQLACAVSHRAVSAVLRDRRLGRAVPPEQTAPALPHLAPFDRVEAFSMLDQEPPVHTRLRGLVLRDFTSRRIAALAPSLSTLCHALIDAFPAEPFDLLAAYARPIPVIIIARLFGVPETDAAQLLAWSNAMVAMYQARRGPAIEQAAAAAAADFSAYLTHQIAAKQSRPGDDLLSTLVAARDGGDRLSEAELISTAILLLNAGHEATVHTIGNAVKTQLETGDRRSDAAAVEEHLRYDPPLHMFTRWVYAPVSFFGHHFGPGDRIACLLGSAGRDESVFVAPDRFDPVRNETSHLAFGAGIHFCVGAPLARLELHLALAILHERCPNLRLAAAPRYADTYHFHGLDQLMVTA